MANRLRAVVAGFAIAITANAGGAGTLDETPAAGAAPLQIYAVPALADALRELALHGACPRTALPELVLSDAATIVQQIERGAPADVLVTDDAVAIERLVATGRAGAARPFATAEGAQGVSYWIAPLRDAPHAAGAADFIDFVVSERGQRLLERAELPPAADARR